MSKENPAYASDEDVALVALADFPIICPTDQVIVKGTDGSFSSNDPMVLLSNSASFANVCEGYIVRLIRPSDWFPAPGVLCGVVSSTNQSITLRRPGLSADQSAPIAPPGGLTGVEFLVSTLQPQLERASRDLDRVLGLYPGEAHSTALESGDFDAIRNANVYLVLYQRYLAVARQGSRDTGFAAKAQTIKAELDELIASLALHWKSARPGIGTRSGTPRFSTRITR